jgi:hypothetical protein
LPDIERIQLGESIGQKIRYRKRRKRPALSGLSQAIGWSSMTHGKALKAIEVERIHADLIKHDEAKLAIANKYKITLETLNKIDRVRKIAGKYGPQAALRVRGHKVQKQRSETERENR